MLGINILSPTAKTTVKTRNEIIKAPLLILFLIKKRDIIAMGKQTVIEALSIRKFEAPPFAGPIVYMRT
jgi:hypothetical protein